MFLSMANPAFVLQNRFSHVRRKKSGIWLEQIPDRDDRHRFSGSELREKSGLDDNSNPYV